MVYQWVYGVQGYVCCNSYLQHHQPTHLSTLHCSAAVENFSCCCVSQLSWWALVHDYCVASISLLSLCVKVKSSYRHGFMLYSFCKMSRWMWEVVCHTLSCKHVYSMVSFCWQQSSFRANFWFDCACPDGLHDTKKLVVMRHWMSKSNEVPTFGMHSVDLISLISTTSIIIVVYSGLVRPRTAVSEGQPSKVLIFQRPRLRSYFAFLRVQHDPYRDARTTWHFALHVPVVHFTCTCSM